MSLRKRLELDAELVPVAQDFTAKTGQHLIIVAGVCLGVYSGNPRSTEAAAPKAAQATLKPRLEMRRSRSRHGPERFEEFQKSIPSRLREEGGTLMAGELMKRVGATAGPVYSQYRRAIVTLKARGVILQAGDKHLTKYMLAAPAAA